MYYSPKPILRVKDLDNEEPAIYMITTNRSGGKTTAFLKKSLADFKSDGSQVLFLYRYSYELSSCADIYADVLNLYPQYGFEVKSFTHAKGLFYELQLDKQTLGYAVSLSNPDALKKYSPIFAKVKMIIFDEFQVETGRYLPKEVEKLQSIYLTVARGGGKQSRAVKVFMLSNMVSIMNPYFIEFGIHKRLRDNTHFLRGNGWVAEFGYISSASKAIKENGFFKAFKGSAYMNFSTESIYLHDADVFVQKPKGKSKYIFTIIHDGISYGVREYFETGIIYVSGKPDNSCRNVVTFKASDHNQTTMMLNHYSFLWKNIRDAYNNGYLRFDDVKAKNAIFDILGVDIYK